MRYNAMQASDASFGQGRPAGVITRHKWGGFWFAPLPSVVLG